MAAVINLSLIEITLVITLSLSTIISDAQSQTTGAANTDTSKSPTAAPTTLETTPMTTTPKTCIQNPVGIENGNVTVNETTVNSRAKYFCNEGYRLTGNGTIICQTNGTWQTTNATCIIKHCPGNETQIENGHINVTDTQVNATANIKCNSGYQPNGNSLITCLSDGYWQAPEANCTIKDCHVPKNISHGTVNYTVTTVNSTAEYHCDKRYQLEGAFSAEIICQPDGNWSTLVSSCIFIARDYNDSCEESAEEQPCSTHNASCRTYDGDKDYRCRCNHDYYYQQENNSCIERIAYQQPCQLNGTKEQCKTVNASCLKDGWCLCEEDDYYDSKNDSCKPRPVVSEELDIVIDHNLVKLDSINVEWTAADKRDTGKYMSILEWDPPSKNNRSHYEKEWGKIGNHITVETLLSGTNYTFYLYLSYMDHRTKLLSTASAYTKPSQIQYITFYKYGENYTTVEWFNNPELPCTGYYIFINDELVGNREREGNTSRYNITNLTGGSSYEIKVISNVPGQNSSAFQHPFYTRPKPVTSADITQIGPNSITLQLVNEDKEKDESYHLYVCPNTSIENPIRNTSKNISITGLNPATQYMIRIYTFYKNLESERFLTIIRYTTPLSPENLSATDILENSLELQWVKPNSSFDQYILEYLPLDSKETTTININNRTIRNYLIKNLTSGTGYSFRLYSAINGTKSLEPAVYEVYTQPIGPEEPTLKERLDTSISIQFPDDNNSYTSYQIDGQLYNRNNGLVTIQNLTAGQYHTFTIFTVANYTELSLTNITYTEFTLPGPPTNITFPDESLHETNLTVEWENVTEGNVDGYIVQFADGESVTQELNDTFLANNAVFTNLTAGIGYTVTIKSTWNGEFSFRTLEGYTFTRPPAPEVAIVDVTETTMTLNVTDKLWEGYRIIVNSDYENYTEFRSDELPYNIEDLTAGTEYSLEVYSIIGGVVGENGRQVSSYTKPDRVSNDKIQVDKNGTTNTSLAVTWERPDIGLVDRYELNVNCTSPNEPQNLMLNFTKKTNETKALVWGLEPGTFCTVNITTHVGNQTGATTQKNLEWSTDETAPEEVQNFSIETKARSLHLIWSEPTKPNGIIRKYAVDVRDGNRKNCSYSRTLLTCTNCSETSDPDCEGSFSGPWTTDPCNDSLTDFSSTFDDAYIVDYNVTDLHPYRNYTVVVTPFSRCYGKPLSQSHSTKQAVPNGAPTDVEQDLSETTANSLSITWTPPEENSRNGIITQYTVYYKYKNRTCFGNETGDDIMENFNVTSSGTNISTPDRYPFWSYEVNISAWTTIGEGPKSESVTFMTKASTPDKVRSAPTVANTTQFSVELRWQPPCFVNGIINHYRIQVFNVFKNSSTFVKNITTMSNDTQENIKSLDPYHNYTLYVSAVNTVGQEGPAVEASEVAKTETGVPHKPKGVTATANSSQSIRVTWQTPDLYTGVTRYNVTAKDTQNFTYFATSEFNFYLAEMIIDGLDAFWNYTVTVTAITDAGQNKSNVSVVVRTSEAVPGKVGNLTLETEQNVTKPRSIAVTWTGPVLRDLNGILTSYYVKYIRTGVSVKISLAVTEEVDVERKSHEIQGIIPGSYDVTVYASTKVGNGTTFTKNITVPPGAPIRVEESATDPLLKESASSSPSETQIPIQLPTNVLCDESNGVPIFFGLVVAADSQATDKPFIGSRDEFNARNKTYKTWFDINGMAKPQPYITTATDWNPCKKRRKRSSDSQTRSFTIGTQGDCGSVAPGTYCNGQLKPGTSYKVKAFSCTDGGCTETMYSKVIKTEVGKPAVLDNYFLPVFVVKHITVIQATQWYTRHKFECTVERTCMQRIRKSLQITLNISMEPINIVIPIVGGLVAALVVSAVAIVVVIYLRRKQSACFAKSAEDGITHSRSEPIQATELAERNSSSRVFSRPKSSPSPCQVRLSEFPDYVDKLKKDSGLLLSEAYKMIKEYSPEHSKLIAESQICRPKNRYTNILPFDHSRVKLLPLDDEEGTDYINANYIPGYTSRREYIATQGPMPSTFDDFWRMVWEQNVEIIVMLTKLVEKGRNKCDKYWPNQNEPQFYGDLSVSVMSESNLSDYTIRIMELKLKEEKRTVKQFSFLKWPDMGCPEYPDLLLEFVKSVQQHKSSGSERRPMVVHCSAGVGRTGTFIAVDHLLQHIRDHEEIDIYTLVLEMRNNRCNMVQTEDQYVYIHECIREFISSDDQDDEDDDDEDHIYSNTQQENVYENTGFGRQY